MPTRRMPLASRRKKTEVQVAESSDFAGKAISRRKK